MQKKYDTLVFQMWGKIKLGFHFGSYNLSIIICNTPHLLGGVSGITGSSN